MVFIKVSATPSIAIVIQEMIYYDEGLQLKTSISESFYDSEYQIYVMRAAED